jgi:2-keto-4-pentenoate hydratase
MTPAKILEHYDQAALWANTSGTLEGMEVAVAYQTALQVRQLRVARGEQPRGYKIGFTNRSIWPRYNVAAPIWGTVWSTTLAFCDGDATLALAGRCQPRIEPEAVFGMRATPPQNATLDALLDCIEWVAPGFEIVQSHAPGWKFNAATAVADGALHSHLLVGGRVAVGTIAASAQAFNHALAGCQLALHKDGTALGAEDRSRHGPEQGTQSATLIERGQGRNVLDSPLLALLHFLNELRQCSSAPDLLPGDVVTTGTWTDAWPVAAGETWRAEFDAPLSALSVTFT